MVQPAKEGLSMIVQVERGNVLGFRSSRFYVLAKSVTGNNLVTWGSI